MLRRSSILAVLALAATCSAFSSASADAVWDLERWKLRYFCVYDGKNYSLGSVIYVDTQARTGTTPRVEKYECIYDGRDIPHPTDRSSVGATIAIWVKK